MSLREQLNRIRAGLRSGQFVNEAAVSQGIVMPILQELGWVIFDPTIVAPEFTLEGRRVDFALCHPPTKPMVFVEVKQPGKSGGADRQLFEYAFHEGIPFALLTDGQEWHFYLPAEQGRYQERRVYMLDILEREPDESERRLVHYLSYERVRSGTAITAARTDYQDIRRQREVEATIPKAWAKLVAEQDELLTELIADQVESLCGYKPDLDAIGRFLEAQVRAPFSDEIAAAPSQEVKNAFQRRSVPPPTPRAVAVPVTAPQSDNASAYGFEVNGKVFRTRNARDTLLQFFDALTTLDPHFLERFAALPKHGRRRRYLARTKEDLYPGREDLAQEYSSELRPGWWVGTNYSTRQIDKIIHMASETAGLTVGRDVMVLLPDH